MGMKGLTAIFFKGEAAGHPFRGNQYTEGQSGQSEESASQSSSDRPQVQAVTVETMYESALKSVESFSTPFLESKLASLGMSKEEAAAKFAEAKEYNKGVREDDSKRRNTDADGNYKPERAAVHQQIIDKVFSSASKPKEGEPPTLFMMGGVSGSGKSTMKMQPMFDEQRSGVALDIDEYREQLGRADGYDKLGMHTSEYQKEVEDIGARVHARAIQEGYNVCYDCTMKTAEKTARIIDLYRDAGYKVEIAFAKPSMITSLERSVSRFLEGGRYLDPKFVAGQDTKNWRTMELLKSRVDKWSVWDTSENGKPKLLDRSA